jgi:hypothetical protein
MHLSSSSLLFFFFWEGGGLFPKLVHKCVKIKKETLLTVPTYIYSNANENKGETAGCCHLDYFIRHFEQQTRSRLIPATLWVY